MKTMVLQLTDLWDTKVNCTACAACLDKRSISDHYQYCKFCNYFESSKFKISKKEILNFINITKFCDKKLRLVRIAFYLDYSETHNKLEKFPRYVLDKFLLKDSKINNRMLSQNSMNECLDISNITFIQKIAVFFNCLDQISDLSQSLHLYIQSSSSLKHIKSHIQRSMVSETFFEYYNIRIDSKISLNSSWYTENENNIAISDSNKIFIYESDSNKFLTKICGNRSKIVALVPKLYYIFFQNHDFNIIIYNYKTKFEEHQLKTMTYSNINYFKVSCSSEFLFAKFDSNEIYIWNILTKTRECLINKNIEVDFILHSFDDQILLFNFSIVVFDFKKMIEKDLIYKNQNRIDFLMLNKDDTIVLGC